jgi:hypothetical protein
VPTTRQTLRSYCILTSALLLPLLPACDSFKSEQTTDVNVIIPQLMKDWTARKPEEAAAQLFDVTSPDERREAVAYLSVQPYGHDVPYMKAYTFLTTDPSPMVRAQAYRALGGACSPDVVPLLLGKTEKTGITDPDPLVRADCALSLYYSYTDAAIDPLLNVLKTDESAQARANAARALARTTEPRAIKGLIEALSDRDAVVVHDAAQSLNLITGQYIGTEPRPWREWYQSQSWAKTPPSEPAKEGG